VGAVATRLRGSLRGRRASALAIVLLIAVAGGAVLAATADPSVGPPDRSDDLSGYERVNATPLVLAGLLALLIGLPVGVALGRWRWTLLADRLGIPSEPVGPVSAVLLAVPATFALRDLVAALPGRHAGAVPAATVLRAG
jgi:hypothetical protein